MDSRWVPATQLVKPLLRLAGDQDSPLGSGVVGIGIPCRAVVVDRLRAPDSPARPGSACEQLKIWARAASLDDRILFIGLAAVFALSRPNVVNLCTALLKRAGILAPHPKQQNFRYISKVKADTAPVRAAVFSKLMPYDIAFVVKTPSLQYLQALRKEGVGNP